MSSNINMTIPHALLSVAVSRAYSCPLFRAVPAQATRFWASRSIWNGSPKSILMASTNGVLCGVFCANLSFRDEACNWMLMCSDFPVPAYLAMSFWHAQIGSRFGCHCKLLSPEVALLVLLRFCQGLAAGRPPKPQAKA